MKKMKKIVISTEELRKIEKTSHRKALIEAGLYAIPTHKIFKSDKSYTRTPKHKKNYV